MLIKLAVGAVFAAAIELSSWQLAGPQGNVELSKETTFIFGPPADDGLPNYAQAILDYQRRGVTPENNAARLFWQAMGPVELTPEHHALLFKVLRVPESSAPCVVEVTDDDMVNRVANWLSSQTGVEAPSGQAGPAPDVEQLRKRAGDAVSAMSKRPWRSDALPPVAETLATTTEALDLIVAAAALPRFYSPPPNVLENPEVPMVEALLPHAKAARRAVRSLLARAMNRAGEGQYDAAWQDILACWRLGDHLCRNAVLIEKLVGMAFRQVAKDCTVALLQVEDLPEEFAKQILDDLNAQTSSIDVGHALDDGERLMFLDTVLRHITARLGGPGAAAAGAPPAIEEDFDPNLPLRITNRWLDRWQKAALVEDWAERQKAAAQFEADLTELAAGLETKKLLAKFSRSKREEVVGEIMVTLLMPSVTSVIEAQQRDCVGLTLTRTAAALAVYRGQQGEYPSALDALVPALLDEVPRDLYGQGTLVYERRGDGYLLYSVFENGVNDGGTDFGGEIVKGEWAKEDARLERDHENSDFVIRMPRPWPPLIPATDAP
jgi:hypothetical protein